MRRQYVQNKKSYLHFPVQMGGLDCIAWYKQIGDKYAKFDWCGDHTVPCDTFIGDLYDNPESLFNPSLLFSDYNNSETINVNGTNTIFTYKENYLNTTHNDIGYRFGKFYPDNGEWINLKTRAPVDRPKWSYKHEGMTLYEPLLHIDRDGTNYDETVEFKTIKINKEKHNGIVYKSAPADGETMRVINGNYLKDHDYYVKIGNDWTKSDDRYKNLMDEFDLHNGSQYSIGETTVHNFVLVYCTGVFNIYMAWTAGEHCQVVSAKRLSDFVINYGRSNFFKFKNASGKELLNLWSNYGYIANWKQDAPPVQFYRGYKIISLNLPESPESGTSYAIKTKLIEQIERTKINYARIYEYEVRVKGETSWKLPSMWQNKMLMFLVRTKARGLALDHSDGTKYYTYADVEFRKGNSDNYIFLSMVRIVIDHADNRWDVPGTIGDLTSLLKECKMRTESIKVMGKEYNVYKKDKFENKYFAIRREYDGFMQKQDEKYFESMYDYTHDGTTDRLVLKPTWKR